MRVYRLTLVRYAGTAFSGEGARRAGSRWTPAGYPAVHTAGSIALAVLETLVHTGPSVMPSHRVMAVDVPDTVPVAAIEPADLPDHWRRTPPPPALQALGKAWLEAGETALLALPSAIIPRESSYLINPRHSDFPRLVIHPPDPFEIDRRLFRSSP